MVIVQVNWLLTLILRQQCEIIICKYLYIFKLYLYLYFNLYIFWRNQSNGGTVFPQRQIGNIFSVFFFLSTRKFVLTRTKCPLNMQDCAHKAVKQGSRNLYLSDTFAFWTLICQIEHICLIFGMRQKGHNIHFEMLNCTEIFNILFKLGNVSNIYWTKCFYLLIKDPMSK